jgi:hypothetical protein
VLGAHTPSDDPSEGGAVLWSTVQAFKGLERPVVILAEVGERHEDEIEPYLRVGGTRARNHLIVIATEAVAASLRSRARSFVSENASLTTDGGP